MIATTDVAPKLMNDKRLEERSDALLTLMEETIEKVKVLTQLKLQMISLQQDLDNKP